MRDNVYIRLGVPVTVVCLVAAAGLALTWSVTEPRIAAQAVAAERHSLESVLPDAKGFEKVSAARLSAARKAGGDVGIDGVFDALDASGQRAGMAVLVSSRGYGGPIRMAVGLDSNGKVTGVSIISMNETPGLGSRIVEDPSFMKRFAGVESADAARKVDTITGATKSSRGVRKGVEAALKAYQAAGQGGS